MPGRMTRRDLLASQTNAELFALARKLGVAVQGKDAEAVRDALVRSRAFRTSALVAALNARAVTAACEAAGLDPPARDPGAARAALLAATRASIAVGKAPEPLDVAALPRGERRAVAALYAALLARARIGRRKRGRLLATLGRRLVLGDGELTEAAARARREPSPETHAARIATPAFRHWVLWDLLNAAVQTGGYDAREREALRHMAEAFGIRWRDVCRYECLLAATFKAGGTSEDLEAVLREQPVTGRKRRITAVAAATGAVMALAGGLAGPVVLGAAMGPILSGSGAGAVSAGLTGVGARAAPAVARFVIGRVASAALFGGAGAGIGGYKMYRRTGTVKEFRFLNLGGEGLHVCVAVSGFLSEGSDFAEDWAPLPDVAHGAEVRVLGWESRALRDLGVALSGFGAKFAVGAVARRLTRQGLKRLWGPAGMLAFTEIIDNPWHVAVDRADRSAGILAEVLRKRQFGRRPVTLVGFSLGARVIAGALRRLGERRAYGLVHDAVLMGGAVSPNDAEWGTMRRAVAGRLVNVYSGRDWVLWALYRAAQFEREAAGLGPVDAPEVENVDVTDLAPGHLAYRKALGEVLARVRPCG